MCRVKRVGGNTFFTVRSLWQYVQWLGSLFAQGSENQLAFVSAWISSCVILFFMCSFLKLFHVPPLTGTSWHVNER